MQYDKYAISGPRRSLGRRAPGFEARRRQGGSGSPSTPPRRWPRGREPRPPALSLGLASGSCLGRERRRGGESFPLALRVCGSSPRPGLASPQTPRWPLFSRDYPCFYRSCSQILLTRSHSQNVTRHLGVFPAHVFLGVF